MEFFKYHGTGNDFVLFPCPQGEPFLDSSRIARICRRSTGVGADGVIFACPSPAGGDGKMRIFNADGSEAEMCGNGIRCLARYLYEREGVRREEMIIETLAGARRVKVFPGGKGDFEVEVDMGMPEFPAPRAADGGEISRHGKARITLEEETVEAVCLSMGNPHCVLFVPDVSRAPVAGLGSSLEKHPLFPQRTNVEFAQVENRGFIFLRVWERGVGETASCGTGACAAFVAAFETGLTDGNAVVALPGGNLRMHIDEFGHVYMRGPAVEVFHGKLNPSWLREEDGGNAGEG